MNITYHSILNTKSSKRDTQRKQRGRWRISQKGSLKELRQLSGVKSLTKISHVSSAIRLAFSNGTKLLRTLIIFYIFID